MKQYPTLREGEGDQGASNGGGEGTLLGNAPAQQNAQQTPPASTDGQQDEGAASKFDFRSVIGEDGKFKQNWADSLPDALKPAKNELGKYADPEQLLLGHWNKAQMLGRQKEVKPPLPDAKPEEIAAWKKTIGAPETPDGYKFEKPANLPEGMQWDEATVKNFAKVAHELNLTPYQASKLAEYDLAQKQTMIQAGQGIIAESRTKAEAQLKGEWGDNYKQNIETVKGLVAKGGGDPLDPEIGNNPKLLKLLLNFSSAFKEDRLIEPSGPSTSLRGEDAVRDVMTNPANPWHAAYHNKMGPQHQQAALEHINALRGNRG